MTWTTNDSFSVTAATNDDGSVTTNAPVDPIYAGYLSARVIIDRGGHNGGSQPAPVPAAVPAK